MTSYTKPYIVAGVLMVIGAFLFVFMYQFGLGCLIGTIGLSIGAAHGSSLSSSLRGEQKKGSLLTERERIESAEWWGE